MTEQLPTEIAPRNRRLAGAAIDRKVWRKGWRRDATATQMAAAGVAAFIRKLENDGLTTDADIFRRAAMQHGVRNAEAIVWTALREWRARREKSK